MSQKLYVGNLNYKTTEDTLKQLFSQYGEVISVNILQGRGFGFIEMATPESAEKGSHSCLARTLSPASAMVGSVEMGCTIRPTVPSTLRAETAQHVTASTTAHTGGHKRGGHRGIGSVTFWPDGAAAIVTARIPRPAPAPFASIPTCGVVRCGKCGGPS